jgi:hypothetical protein
VTDRKQPALATVDPDGSTVVDRSTPQQRFEESRAGKVVISVFIALFVLIGVVWNIPDSPIGRGLQTLVKPVASLVGLDQNWGMYGTPTRRVETIEVHVAMADGEDRVWTMQPGERGVGWWDRWILLKRSAMVDSSIRPQLAHWVVGQITKPDERASSVSIVLRTENLFAPGEQGAGSRGAAKKVLYQEALAGPR